MALQRGTGPNYLTWKDFRFGSDSIIVSFRYEKYRHMLDEVQRVVPNYKSFVEDYLHRAYTIGGMMIFPKHAGSINQAKGTSPKLRDRVSSGDSRVQLLPPQLCCKRLIAAT